MKGNADTSKFVDKSASKLKVDVDVVLSDQMRVSEVVMQPACIKSDCSTTFSKRQCIEPAEKDIALHQVAVIALAALRNCKCQIVDFDCSNDFEISSLPMLKGSLSPECTLGYAGCRGTCWAPCPAGSPKGRANLPLPCS